MHNAKVDFDENKVPHYEFPSALVGVSVFKRKVVMENDIFRTNFR